ncbi:MAG: hypothetical protein H7306_17175 [Bacteriovorax sp.]|nr:hypothetical protein [Rhizobacter sp.]
MATMVKHIATAVGVILAGLFIVVFFTGRPESKQLSDVAPRVGMSVDDLMALGPRVSTSTGTTLGSSRRVVYLLACSGQASKTTLEDQANLAGTLVRRERLTDREAVNAVLAPGTKGGAESLKGC